MAKADPARKAVLQLLCEGEKEGAHIYALLQHRLEQDTWDEKERALIRMLTGECVKRRITLDEVISRFTKENRRISVLVRNVLRMGICQILFFERIPDAAAVSTSVELVRARGLNGFVPFVNAVLRKVASGKNDIEFSTISTRYSVPQWLCNRLVNQYGEETCRQMFAYFLETPPLTIRMRMDLRENGRAKLAGAIRASSQRSELNPHPLYPFLFHLRHGGDIRKLPGFAEGKLTVQDGASVTAALCAGVKPFQRVIDVCAAPGGKSMLLAELMRQQETEAAGSAGEKPLPGVVLACDISAEKCEKIRENVDRMGLENMEIVTRDARLIREEWRGSADIVLCDLPCSGIGTLSHKADLKYRLREADISFLQSLQREILGTASAYLKEGGVLLYSTCTLTREENEENAAWIRETLGLKPDDLTPFLPEALRGIPTAKQGYLTLIPGVFRTDGFFIARFVKEKEGTSKTG